LSRRPLGEATRRFPASLCRPASAPGRFSPRIGPPGLAESASYWCNSGHQAGQFCSARLWRAWRVRRFSPPAHPL